MHSAQITAGIGREDGVAVGRSGGVGMERSGLDSLRFGVADSGVQQHAMVIANAVLGTRTQGSASFARRWPLRVPTYATRATLQTYVIAELV